MLSFNHYSNAESAVIKLLKYLSISINPDDIIAELDKHPDYPSLLAISDVLNKFNIGNSAFRIEADDLVNMPCPFIAHTTSNGGDFLAVDKIDEENVSVSNEKWTKHKISLVEFKKRFSGIVLTAERLNSTLTADSFANKLASLRYPLAASGIVLILILTFVCHSGYTNVLNWKILVLNLIKTIGLITSILLLVQSIDNDNPLIQNLCKSNDKVDCNAILSSKAAKVFAWLSWSEVGFFYFAGSWILLIFNQNSTMLMQCLAVLNVVSLPYTFYSIYYQARIAKKWCLLCCTVQAILWLEFAIMVFSLRTPFLIPNNSDLSKLVIAMLLPIVFWALAKPMLLKVQQVKALRDQLRKFKYNTEVFDHLLKEQPKYSQPHENWSIILGNMGASNSITMVTNPYCPPCSTTHKLLDELLSERDDIQARIVFTAQNTNEDIKRPVSRHLMALNDLADKTIVRKALRDWYEQEQKNYDAWAKVYPVKFDEANYHKLDNQKKWCEMAEVTATPTLLINGYRLPDLYQLTDLKYLLN